MGHGLICVTINLMSYDIYTSLMMLATWWLRPHATAQI